MRNLGLDLLRTIAVLLVLGRHLHLPADPNFAMRAWQTGGWVGVDLFFVLSGFLVSGLLCREYQRDQSVDLKRFLVRRGFKIYPAFYAMIGFTIIVKISSGQSIPIRQLVGEITFLQNYLGGIWIHTWSLAVEEHFYMGIAILMSFSASKKAPNSRRFRSVSMCSCHLCRNRSGVSIAENCKSIRIRFIFSSMVFIWDSHSN